MSGFALGLAVGVGVGLFCGLLLAAIVTACDARLLPRKPDRVRRGWTERGE